MPEWLIMYFQLSGLLHLMVAELQVNNSSNYNYELGISTPKRRTKSHVILVAHINTFSVLMLLISHIN